MGKWTPAYARVCGEVGLVLLDDESDGTSRVSFPSLKLGAWFPTSALTDAHEAVVIRRIKVAALDKLRAAVDAHEAIKWHEKIALCAEQEGDVMIDDASDGTSHVKFGAPIDIDAWLPTSVLDEIAEEADSKPTAKVENGHDEQAASEVDKEESDAK